MHVKNQNIKHEELLSAVEPEAGNLQVIKGNNQNVFIASNRKYWSWIGIENILTNEREILWKKNIILASFKVILH